MGKKNSELTLEIRKEIVRIFNEMEESSISKVFPNEEFGHWRITILQPEYDEHGCAKKDKKGHMVPNKTVTDSSYSTFDISQWDTGIYGVRSDPLRS